MLPQKFQQLATMGALQPAPLPSNQPHTNLQFMAGKPQSNCLAFTPDNMQTHYSTTFAYNSADAQQPLPMFNARTTKFRPPILFSRSSNAATTIGNQQSQPIGQFQTNDPNSLRKEMKATEEPLGDESSEEKLKENAESETKVPQEVKPMYKKFDINFDLYK